MTKLYKYAKNNCLFEILDQKEYPLNLYHVHGDIRYHSASYESSGLQKIVKIYSSLSSNRQ